MQLPQPFSRLHALRDLQSWTYLLRSFTGWIDPELHKCPVCGVSKFRVVASKAIVTRLVRCGSCRLLFRIPRDPIGFAEEFYQEDYSSGGLTTRPVRNGELARLLSTGFRGTDKDFTDKIRVLESLGIPKGARVLDFGASWGYLTWQLQQAGYEAAGYEISRPRAQFGREYLGVRIFTDKNDLTGPFDVFFSSHVLEHVSNPVETFTLATRVLKTGGVFAAFTPNGSEMCLRADRRRYNQTWGRLHPLYLDEVFYRHNLPEGPKLILSRRYGDWHDLSDIALWDRKTDVLLDMSLPELLAVWICPPASEGHAPDEPGTVPPAH